MDLRDQLQGHLGAAFQIKRELGGGGMSRVFVATEIRLSRAVVIKVLSPELSQGLNAERFEREILLAASLQQANIVPVLAAGDVDGLPYFTMPFVEGESLRSRLTGGGLPIADVIAVLRDVTKALAYAHARGIVHRDIKPDNVLLSGGTAVVTDFGIAKALSASRTQPAGATLTSVGTSIGTPAYMAPEQVAGDPNLDHRVDLYALGCMAHELLTGRSPFADHTPQKMLAAHLSEAPRPIVRGDCPPALAWLVAQLLAKDPADRPASASVVLQTLDGVSTTSGATLSLHSAGMLPKVLGIYVAITAAVLILAKAAVVGIGLPEWTLTGAAIVMALGLPALLFTAWVKRTAHKAAIATPTLTPGGHSIQPAPSGTMANIALRANPHVSWRRTARGGVYAMGGFVLLVAAFMITRQLGIGPAASLFGSGVLAAEDRILLAEISSQPQDSVLAPIIVEAVRAALSQSRAVRVLSATDVAIALGEMQRPNDTRLDPVVAREVAARTGAKAILTGRLAPISGGYLVSLELTSADSGVTLASFQGTADGGTSLLEAVDDLTRKLRSKLGESLRQVQRSVPLERATTSSLEALRKYTEGTRANDVDADFDRAVRALREAVAIDSTFALAWRKLSAALYNSRASQAAADSALERASQYSERLPPLERYLITGALYDLHGTRADRSQSLRAYQSAYALDSTGSVTINQLAMLFGDRGQQDSALRYAHRKVELADNPYNRAKLAQTLAWSGQTAAAAALVDSIRRGSPEQAGDALLNYLVAENAYVHNDFDSTLAVARSMQQSTLAATRVDGMGIGAQAAIISGRLQQSSEFLIERDALRASRGDDLGTKPLADATAAILYREKVADGMAILDRWVSSPEWIAAAPVERPYLDVARLYARAGAPDRARAILSRYRAEVAGAAEGPALRELVAAVMGEISLAEGNIVEAQRQFRAALVAEDGAKSRCYECALFGIARSFDRAGQRDSVRVYLEQYLSVPQAYRLFTGSDVQALAAVRKRLGELYDEANNRTKAIEYYSAFVDQWAKADAELQPVVASVRARLNVLRGQEGP